MKNHSLAVSMFIVAGTLIAGLVGRAGAQTTSNDDFTQPSDTNSWKTFDGACLTAGNGTASSIPACVGLPYYGTQIQIGGQNGFLGTATSPSSAAAQTPDQPGHGALRFTNWFQQAGSIISSGTPFPTGTGLQVVFKTVTYHGDSGGSGGDGADGMGFFLMDGSLPPYDTGAFGGSLGYTCTNELGNNDPTLRLDGTVRGFDGLVGGYIGLGIDEYGNFLNPGDNTATGPSFLPGRIGLRGKGSISFGWLNANFPTQYPATLLTTPDAGTVTAARRAVHDTCSTGHIWDFSNASAPFDTLAPVADYAPVGSPVTLSTILPGTKIANEAAATRDAAQPITYALKITQNGILSLNISYNGGNYQPVITKQDITASNGALPPSFRFGFPGSTGGSRNVHEILCFQAAPSDVAGTSVGVNKQEATKIASGTQAYLAFYFPGDNTGRLTANNLLFDGTNITIAPTANWDASCNLTGVLAGQTCASTGTGAMVAQGPGNRTMLSWNGTQGVAFRWNAGPGGNISNAQQNTLDAGDPSPFNANRLRYLRGDRSNEINTLGAGLFRARDGVLGDIVDSRPTWVGPPTTHYSALWKDQLIPTDPTPENSGTQSFLQYTETAQTRLNVVYTGANDGFLHGFRSGSFDVNGVYVNNATTPNDGKEVLAYMPAAVVNTIHNAIDGTQDLSGPKYSHNFYVDATPDVDDVFYRGGWHTWLVGGLGAGGAAIYALDVTDPTTFSESNAKNLVMGEWSPAAIGCTNVSGCGANMGNTYGTPIVRRLHDGNWAVIFGNGFGSSTGDAGIFILLLDSNGNSQPSTTFYLSTGMGSGATGTSITFTGAPSGTSATLAGTPTFANGIWGITFSDREVRTVQGSGTAVTWTGALTGTPTTAATVHGVDGIAYVTSADLDGDHITNYVYAGDLLGNVWRFDLTSAVEGNWAAASTPLFTTSAGQPISTKLQVLSVPQGSGPPRIMIDFGTGQQFPQTNLTPTSYQGGVQSLYGVWDWNLGNWNGKSTTQFLSLPSGATAAPSAPLNSSNLQTQTLTPIVESDMTHALDISFNVVCWAGSGTCTGSNNQFGFATALPGVQEQIVFNPLVFQNAFIVNTTIPAVNSPSSCTVQHNTGNPIAISLVTGGSLGNNVTGTLFVASSHPNLAGVQTNGTGTPFAVLAGGKTFLMTQTLGDTGGGGGFMCSGKVCSTPVQAATLTSKRLTWIERR